VIQLTTNLISRKAAAANKLGLRNLNFADIHASPDGDAIIPGLKPDIAVYKNGSKASGTNFGQMELWVEAKSKNDPFQEPALLEALARRDYEGSVTTIETIGRLIAYAVSHLGRGFRTHSFSVCLFKNRARLIRWDRAGAIVTKSFDYVKEPLLVEFFMRFDQLTPEQRGEDSTVRIPSEEDILAASDFLTPKQWPEESEEEFEGCKREFDPATFLEYLVPNPEAAHAEPLRFIGPPPTRAQLSLLGRSSRGCAVYDVQNKCVC
jgi:hypothetical protein